MNKIKSFFVDIWHLFAPVAQKAITDFEAKIESAGPELLQLGIDACNAVAGTVTGNVALRDAAVAKLETDAKAAGIDLEQWAVNEKNTLIELCYLAAKPAITASASAGSEAAAAAQ